MNPEWVLNEVITIGLVMLPVKSDLKLVVGQWIADGEQVCLGEVAAGGNFICSLIVFIFMGYRGALWGEWPLKIPCKYFYFTTGGGWNAWNG